MKITLKTEKIDHLIAWLAALAIMIHIFEAAIPSVLPGLKPGLSNIITIAVLCLFGWGTAAWVSMLRVLVGSLLIGTFLSPTFFMSLFGALASIMILWFASKIPGRGFSAVGYSLLAAMAHMSGQFVCAYLLFIPHAGLWRLFPILMTVAVILGIINGILCQKLITRVEPDLCKA